MSRSAPKGLTIGELVIATGLLAMMVVTVMVFFGRMLDSTTKSALVSQATFFAEAVIEREVYQLQDSAGSLTPVYLQDWISHTDEANKTKFVYRVESIPLDAGTPMGRNYSILVEVRWWTDDAQGESKNRQGFGKMHIKRNRVIYVPNP